MLIALTLILWPVAELYVAIKIAEAIGLLLTVILLIAGWPLGTWVLRTQGRAAWRRLAEAIAAGRPPAREVLDGALVLTAGILLIIPGFITDVVAVTLLAPLLRALPRAILLRNLRSRVVVRALRLRTEPPRYDVESTAADVESTATDVEQPQLKP
jgi:UPF0716 protein FxsA